LNTGARYNPAANTWTPTSTARAYPLRASTTPPFGRDLK
jgi:hypothetical protein